MNKKSIFGSYTIDNIHPGFSVDCVILSFHKKKIRILLNKFDVSNYWQLPGGFMFKNESSDEAAIRILTERTGLAGIYLKQFHLFSDPQRTKMEQNIEYLEKANEREDDVKDHEKWFLQRFITLGYYAFVKYDDVKITSSAEDTVKWFDTNNLPALYSDHSNIIKKSFETVQSLLPMLPVGYELLPEKFTMSELRNIYEFFLDKPLDRRNFQRKVLSSNLVIQLDEIRNTSSYNPPILYSFKKDMKDELDFSVFIM